MLSPQLGGFYYGGLLAGIAAHVAAADGRMIAIQTLDVDERHTNHHASVFDTPVAWDHVDGFLSVVDALDDAQLSALRATGKPVVLVSQEAQGVARIPSVLTDNGSGIRQAIEHLYAHGHRRIAYVGSVLQTDMEERRAAYAQSLSDLGLEVDPALNFVTEDSLEPAGYLAGKAALAAGYDATAVIGATDYNAIGFMAALQEAGYVIPRDQAVVGFDNTERGRYSAPPLASIAQDFAAMGGAAVDALIGLLAGETAAPDVRVATDFVARESCGCDSAACSERELAATQITDKLFFQELLRTEHKISMELLRTAVEGPQSLDWLELTSADAGCLGTWSADRNAPTLNVDSWFSRAGVPPRRTRRVLAPEQFPPAEMLDLVGPGSGKVVLVLRVRRDGNDWGLLAVVAPVEDRAAASNEDTFSQWGALLTVALEHSAVLESLRVSEERYAMAARAANDGLWDWDLVSGVVWYSQRWRSTLRLDPEGTGSSPAEWFNRVHDVDRPGLEQALAAHLSGQTAALEHEHRILAGDGTYRWVLCRGLAVSDGGGPTRIVGSLTDVTERKELQDQLRRDALYDALTGLPNRALFQNRLEWAIERARRVSSYSFAVLFLDVDQFKIVNDSLGHMAGNRLLMAVADRLRTNLRSHDTASRFGGDEFAILLSDLRDVHDLPLIATRMQAELAAPIQLDGHEVVITAAIGIAVSETGYTLAEDVLRDADIAMYRAKSTGKGSFAIFDVGMRTTAVSRLRIESDLRQAVDRGELILHYQPILNLASMEYAGFEALMRWQPPGSDPIPPGEFLPTAEETGLIIKMGEWTFVEACQQIARWQEARPGCPVPPVSINLSNRQFWHHGLLPVLDAALADAGLTSASLRIEITEGVIMHNPEQAVRILGELESRGLRLHIDDFGTGYSSLEALHRFPIEALKIDRSFVSRLGTDTRSTELVRSIVMMGRNLGLDVIAEGIETLEQADLLRSMECGYGQGYLLSRPVGAEAAFDQWCLAGGNRAIAPV